MCSLFEWIVPIDFPSVHSVSEKKFEIFIVSKQVLNCWDDTVFVFFLLLCVFSSIPKKKVEDNKYLRLMAYKESDHPQNHIRIRTYCVYG